MRAMMRGLKAMAAVVIATCAIGACIVADPPPDIPAPPPHHPTILHGSVVPPTTQVLSDPSAANLTFEVPVELEDPNASFEWNVFVDYDPHLNLSPSFGRRESPDLTQVDGGVRIIEFSITPPDPSSCHVIEFVVALEFSVGSGHTPDQYGGDTVSWFYNPSGDPGGCATYDAGGLDGAVPSEAGD
jgi:hypothetical protein